MTFETAFIFALSIILLYIKPGPNQAMKITRALNDGFYPAWFFTLGATSTVVFYFLVAALGAGLIQSAMTFAALGFKILGGFYLIYLGYKALSNLEKGVWQGRKDTITRKDFIENFTIGVVMTLSNPITIFYFISILPGLIGIGTLTLQDCLIGVAIIFTMGNMADMILIGFVAQVREALQNKKIVRNINLFTAVSFILIGGFFLFSAFFL